MRAFAAIAVVLFHSLVIFYPAMFYGLGHPFAPVLHSSFEGSVFGYPILAFFSGPFAVSTFFVLSGFVLSIGFFQTRRRDIVIRLAVKRYLRLMLPALASIIIVFSILALHLDKGKLAAEQLSLAGSSSSLWTMEPNLPVALVQGVWQVFISTLDAQHYNPVLWTMQYEFLGSLLIFCILLAFRMKKQRWLAYPVVMALFINTWYTGFIIGMILADLYASYPKVYSVFSGKKAATIGVFVFLTGLFFGGYPLVTPQTGIYEIVHMPFLAEGINLINFTILGATLVVFSVLAVPWFRDFLKHPRISRLGKYTYSLYLIHLAVLFTITSSLLVILSKIFSYNYSVMMAFILTFPILGILTYMFEKYIDSPAIKLSNLFYLMTNKYLRRLTKAPEPKGLSPAKGD